MARMIAMLSAWNISASRLHAPVRPIHAQYTYAPHSLNSDDIYLQREIYAMYQRVVSVVYRNSLSWRMNATMLSYIVEEKIFIE